ncbi:MAG: M23 family metallopeptidase [Peptococcaceae bacterium]|nr:M23 family metallopeptidase [Peptococcaceae bacterium]
MKGSDFKPGGALQQDDWISCYRQPQWKKPKWEGGRRNNLYRLGAALLILVILLALKETRNPLGAEAREKLKVVLTTEWDYQPVIERVVQFGLQVADVDWPFFSSPRPVLSKQQKSDAAGGLPLPVSGKVVRGFGMVIDPVDNMERFHSGIDIAAPVGSPVRAVQNGTVKRMGDSPVLGRYVLIEHGPGSFSLYGELARATVGEGQTVQAGQVIGEVGNAGDITGGGLHFEIRENNKLVDPLTRLQINH